MATEKPSQPSKTCPTCGTRVSEDATRCMVCGTEFATGDRPSQPHKAVQGSRMPELTLSLPVAIGVVALLIAVGALIVYFALQNTPTPVAEATVTPTITLTPTSTLTPTPETPTPSPSPQPSATPQTYVVKPGETCLGIALSFGVSINSIVLLNPELSADCANVYEAQRLLIPQPTPTSTPPPTSTLNAAEATEAACEKFPYTVQNTDTLSSIALNFNVEMAAIREYNGMVNDIVRPGVVLDIPLCRRNATPGPSPTPTPPPPYSAPNLLLPVDGASFGIADELVTLQWAAVGTLRGNEAYAVTIEDITEGVGRREVAYVTDSKHIVSSEFRASDSIPHVYRWSVITVRQTGSDDSGNPIWEPAGAVSAGRVFSWLSGGPPADTPAPPSATP
ncbi:MAG TPA: LysM peptidoglycan-binding domain-containing protein [Anaerolineales bacterium]|nr:LysM peptidoglycan-binding domain-containing protein [Anaerolineales bacterium]